MKKFNQARVNGGSNYDSLKGKTGGTGLPLKSTKSPPRGESRILCGIAIRPTLLRTIVAASQGVRVRLMPVT